MPAKWVVVVTDFDAQFREEYTDEAIALIERGEFFSGFGPARNVATTPSGTSTDTALAARSTPEGEREGLASDD